MLGGKLAAEVIAERAIGVQYSKAVKDIERSIIESKINILQRAESNLYQELQLQLGESQLFLCSCVTVNTTN